MPLRPAGGPAALPAARQPGSPAARQPGSPAARQDIWWGLAARGPRETWAAGLVWGGHGPALLATGVLPVRPAGAVTGSRVADDGGGYPAGNRARLFSDAWVLERNALIEAKNSDSRDALRAAIGQLYDYRRFHEPLPPRPARRCYGPTRSGLLPCTSGAAYRPLAFWPQTETPTRENARIAILDGAFSLVRGGGQGQDRTADLPLFSSKDHRSQSSVSIHLPGPEPWTAGGVLPRTNANETGTETKGVTMGPMPGPPRSATAPGRPCLQVASRGGLIDLAHRPEVGAAPGAGPAQAVSG